MRRRRPASIFKCDFCSRTYGDSQEAAWHGVRDHRGPWLRRALLDIERAAHSAARYDAILADPCNDEAWRRHPLARRYRRHLRRWWQLDKGEYTKAMEWFSGRPDALPMTRLGWPEVGAPLEAYIARERRKLRGERGGEKSQAIGGV